MLGRECDGRRGGLGSTAIAVAAPWPLYTVNEVNLIHAALHVLTSAKLRCTSPVIRPGFSCLASRTEIVRTSRQCPIVSAALALTAGLSSDKSSSKLFRAFSMISPQACQAERMRNFRGGLFQDESNGDWPVLTRLCSLYWEKDAATSEEGTEMKATVSGRCLRKRSKNH